MIPVEEMSTPLTLAALLAGNPCLVLTTNNKIKCTITNHEMPTRADVVHQYLTSNKFTKAKQWYQHDFSQYSPYIVANLQNDKLLICKLTNQNLK